MHRHFTHAAWAVTAAAAVITLGFAAPAGAGTTAPQLTGPPAYTHGWAGYALGGGRWFRFVSTTLTVPPRTLSSASGDDGFITLQHAKPTGLPFTRIDVTPGGGPRSVTWDTGAGAFRVSPRVGDRLSISIYYDRHGHDYLTAADLTQRTTQTVRLNVGNVVYDLARIGGGPAAGSEVPPAADQRLWQFADSHVTTYSGVHGTILGPWTTSEVTATSTGTPSGTIVASPSALRDGGQSFGVWLRALPLEYTQAFAGYEDSGGPFRFLSASMTVPARQAPSGNSGAAFVSLGHNGGATPRPYADVEVLAGGGAGSISYRTNTAAGTFALSPKVGDRLSVSIYYDRNGHDLLTATDSTQASTQSVRTEAPYTATMPFNSAEVLALISNGAVAAPPADSRLWAFTGSHVTTYGGDHGTILGPWASSEFIDTTDGTAAGHVVMSASVLWNSGQNFGVWLRHR